MIDAIRHALEPHTTFVLFTMVFALLALRVPIGVSLGLPALTVAFIESGKASSLATAVVGAMNEKFLLTAIPFFILSSAFLTSGGAAERIVRFAIAAVGHLRGGMATAGVFSCMLFAALSGSSPATVAAIGPIAIKGMEEAKYPKSFAAGVISTAGTREPSFLRGRRRWLTTPSRTSESCMRTSSCWCGGKNPRMRSTVCTALTVCRVARTRWPVSAAISAALTVSRSRISPTRMTSGVCRTTAFNAVW